MAKYPLRFELPKAKPMAKASKPAASKPAAPKASKPASTRATTQATLDRAARMQAEEAGESLIARSMPPKNKPATPTMSTGARRATQATLDRAARMQAEEARSEALLMKRRAPAKDIISITTRMRETPTKKGK